MNYGWVRISRNIEHNPLYFMEPFTKAQAWIDLFTFANHKQSTISIRGNIITIERGQIAWSELTMAKRWKWSRGKVRRFLDYLRVEGQITTNTHSNIDRNVEKNDKNGTADSTTDSTSVKPYVTTITTIVNYEKYQSDTETVQQTVQQKDNRQYINKNDNNVKNEKKESGVKTPKPTRSKNKTKKQLEEELKQKGRIINKWWVEEIGGRERTSLSFVSGLDFWLQHYGLDEIHDAIIVIGQGKWWPKNPAPTLLFRKKDKQNNDVDYIGELLDMSDRKVKKKRKKVDYSKLGPLERLEMGGGVLDE